MLYPIVVYFYQRSKLLLLTHPLCHKNVKSAKIQPCQDIKKKFFKLFTWDGLTLSFCLQSTQNILNCS